MIGLSGSRVPLITLVLSLASGSLAGLACERDGGAPTDGGAADDTMKRLELPGCLRDLYALCPLGGDCRVQTGDGGTPTAKCYTSGAHIEYSESEYVTAEPACHTLYKQKVFKADGTLCYEQAYYNDGGHCESTNTTWRDAAGNVVATGNFGIIGMTLTCKTTGEVLACNLQTCPREDYKACETGRCP